MKTNDQLKIELIKLRSEGLSYKLIAEQLGVSKPTVIKWSRELAVEISNQKKLEYEAFLVSLNITRESRAKKLKTISDKLEIELEKRDLTDLPTSKLIDQLLKVYSTWGIEVNDISFEAKPMIDFSALDPAFFNENELK